MNTPLELAGRMARKSAALFRSIRHPGMAYFGDIGAGAVAAAQDLAAEAAGDDRAAVGILDAVLADGRVTRAEVRRLKLARRRIAHSAALDSRLAAGGHA